MGEGGSSAAVVREGSRLPLLLNKQRVIVRQVVRLSCPAGSALINPSTLPIPRPTACVLHTTAHI